MVCLLAFLLISGLGRPEQEPLRAEELFIQARKHFENQEWEKAKNEAAKALEINPRLGDAEVMLGLIATVESRFGAAEQHFLRALKLQPQNDQARGYLGSTYLQQKRYAEAGAVFQRVLRQDPQNQAANYNLGLIALIQEKPAQARTRFEQALRKSPDDIPALTGVLECQLLLKQYVESGKLVAKLESLLPPQDPRLFRIATMLALYQQYLPAIAILERVQQAYPKSYDVNYNLELGYLRSEQYARAAATLEPLLGQAKSAEAFNLMGQAKEKLQLQDQAIAAYRRAAELEPESEDYRFDHAYALLQYVSSEAATAAFSSGTRDFPKSWRMRVGLGSSYYLAGKNADAVSALLEAVRLEPAAKIAYYLLGKLYEFAGDGQSAIREVFKAYLGKEPRDPWAHYHYSVMIFAQTQAESPSDFSVVKSHLAAAVALNPNFAEAYLQMGFVAQAEESLEESIQFMEKAVRIDPRLPAAHYRLALVYRRAGNIEKSKAEFESFEKLKAEGGARDKKDVVRSLGEQTK
jgi:tetratricopeptide (TPR) repeat protein